MNASCELFLKRLNRVLDAEAAASTLVEDDHAHACADCRIRLALAKRIAAFPSPVPKLPARFTEAVLAETVKSVVRRKRQRWLVRSGIAALAAAVAVTVWSVQPEPIAPQPGVPMAKAAPPAVDKPLAEAREALVALSTQVADGTITPAKNLLSIKNAKAPETVAVSSPLADLPNAATSGIEPLVSAPRRALNYFVRDMGNVAGNKQVH